MKITKEQVDKVAPTTWPDVVLVLGKAAIQLCGLAVVLWANASDFDITEYRALGQAGGLMLVGNRILDNAFSSLDKRISGG